MSDLIPLDQNLFGIELHTVDKVKVSYTVMDGRFVDQPPGESQ